MKSLINQLLAKHWGYSGFRPLQEDIILSVLDGKDTLALMPTGGGKSICFQVPALAKDGLCLVISPLIALMKDQVEQLKARDIKAVSIVSGMTRKEIDITLDNCIYGNIKFLYVSAERLKTDIFKARLPKMKVNLIAVDEAHCISQWGYDFRPSYLEIAAIRKMLPSVPVLALTATATAEVKDDIQKRLNPPDRSPSGTGKYSKGAWVVFQDSFERKNLSYVVLEEEDKARKMLTIVEKTAGTAIIYVRNRKRTKELAELLQKKGHTADYYHAGLDKALRNKRQDAWMRGDTRIIVATNAFGMGIDKSNVRLVLHYDLTESLEAYYQEAGRAGRDGKLSYTVLLYNKSDLRDAKDRIEFSFPEVSEIKNIYQAMANYLQLPVGSGAGVSYDFNINSFCSSYNLEPLKAFNCFKILEMEELIEISDSIDLPSRVHITVKHEMLYEFQVKNSKFDPVVKTMLRSYEGMFDDYVAIDEEEVAKRSGISEGEVKDMMMRMDAQHLLSYLPKNESPQITFLKERLDLKNINISREHLADRKERHIKNMKAVIRYASTNVVCRQQQMLKYFGEEINHRCGNCDVCIGRNKLGVSDLEFNNVQTEVKAILANQKVSLHQLIHTIKSTNEDKAVKVVEWMIDCRKIRYDEDEMLIFRE